MRKTLFDVKIKIGFFTIFFSLKADERVYLANKEVSEYLPEVRKKYGLRMEGLGGGYSDCEFDNAGLYFCKFGCEPNISEARQYCLEIAYGLVKRINKNKNLLVYVKDHVADMSIVDVRVTFLDANGREPPKDRVAYASLMGKFIYYTYYDGKHYQDLYSEKLTDEQVEDYLKEYEKNPL